MNPRDILEVADNLITGSTEASWRSAVSRAYYAAFHTARILLQRGGFRVPPTEQAHFYLTHRLANSGHPDVNQAGRDLARLRQNRNWADYDLDQPMDHDRAVNFVQIADSILDVLEAVPPVPERLARVIETMKAYERDVLKEVTWHP
jgi:uncharacterized protein (UPF0332 family)